MAGKVRNFILMSFSCFILLMGSSYSSQSIHKLVQGQQLGYEDLLFSAYGIFRLGFFRRQLFHNSRSFKYYIGIWYSWCSEHKVEAVWVANRNAPIYDKSGVLTIGSDGNLKIICSGRDPIVLTSIRVSGNTSATLLDSGNLVLRELNSDGSIKRVLWQSFDHPTDTLLPGMKIGVNLKTGHNWSLTSWTDSTSPAPGSFTFGMDPRGTDQLMIWWAGDVYWSSGTFVNGSFSLSNEFSYHHYHFSFVSNDSERYFTYHINDDTNSFPMIVIDPSGSLLDFARPLVRCRNSVGCAAGEHTFCNDERSRFNFQNVPVLGDFSVGCVLRGYPICRKNLSRTHETSGSVSGYAFKFNENKNMNIIDCREKCLRNCSCVAYASTNANDGTGCQIWSKVKIRTSTFKKRQSIYVLESKEDNQRQEAVRWLVIVVGGAVGMTLLCFSCVLIRRKRSGCVTWPLKPKTLLRMWRKYEKKGMHFLQSIKRTRTEQETLLSELGIDTKHKYDRHGKSSLGLQYFNFESISSAANDFAPTNKLGQGGFGPVYKGQLPDGQEVAIKRLSANSRQGLVEFKNEVKVIAKLQHNNLVRLVGCCIEKEEKILIYEYMPNKSLDFLLFDPQSQNMLDWKKRFNIIEGIAHGLLYLHKHSRLKIIHRDLKASNVLLDSEMNPKISDFGMAKIFGPEESKAKTNRVAGTLGYMSPEYAIDGICSTKSDVYSFGVLLLEIISGRKNNSFHHHDGPLSLAVYAWELWRQGRELELIDPRMGNTYQNEVLRCIHVALLCIQENPMDRPNMLDVPSMLYNGAYQLPSPKQPAFYYRRSVSSGAEIVEHKEGNGSLNWVSITEMEAR